MVKILVVEDDIRLNQMVCSYLNDYGYDTKGCLSVSEAYSAMYNDLYELIISDIMMPEIDGFEFVKNVRNVNRKIPILFMSARDDLAAKKKGYMLGIDDYMVKPIELDELQLRIGALLRRANIENDRRIIVGNLKMDADERMAEVNGEEISLTAREFNILYKMLSFPKKTFSRPQLVDEFWGMESETNLRAVDVYITRIREKTALCNGFQIKTIRGIGYKIILL